MKLTIEGLVSEFRFLESKQMPGLFYWNLSKTSRLLSRLVLFGNLGVFKYFFCDFHLCLYFRLSEIRLVAATRQWFVRAG